MQKSDAPVLWYPGCQRFSFFFRQIWRTEKRKIRFFFFFESARHYFRWHVFLSSHWSSLWQARDWCVLKRKRVKRAFSRIVGFAGKRFLRPPPLLGLIFVLLSPHYPRIQNFERWKPHGNACYAGYDQNKGSTDGTVLDQPRNKSKGKRKAGLFVGKGEEIGIDARSRWIAFQIYQRVRRAIVEFNSDELIQNLKSNEIRR